MRAHIHAPVDWRGDGNTYDKNGNASQIDGDLMAFDVENRLSEVISDGLTTTYLYDGSGEMVRRKVDNGTSGGEVKDAFVGGIYQERSEGCGAPATYTKYYTALGGAIARRTGDVNGDGTLTTGTLVYLLADHLGSTVAEVAASDGSVLATMKYWPFGAPRTGTPPERGYTGQQKEESNSVGLYYYHARFYSAEMGRFASADPIMDGLSRYSYVGDNPVDRVDPTGRCFLTFDGPASAECTPEDVEAWLTCAFTSCGGDAATQKLALGGIQQAIFWTHVELLYAQLETFGATLISDYVLLPILRDVNKGEWLKLPESFFQTIGVGIFGMRTSKFFRYSLYDLAFGSSITALLSNYDIVGAWDWWSAMAGATRFANIKQYLGGAGRLNDILFSLTLRAGAELREEHGRRGTDVNKEPWSIYQREHLSGRLGSPFVFTPTGIPCAWGSVSCAEQISSASRGIAGDLSKLRAAGF